jgi:glycosyltransferase involved in cell wall biosynthesis
MPKSFAVILEWETGLDCPAQRIHDMLAALAKQIRPYCTPCAFVPETIICFDDDDSTEPAIRVAADAAAGGEGWPGTLRVVSAPRRLDYYQKKNFGFTFADSDIIVFLDSDVIPEAGWLAALLAAVEHGNRAVVMGRTHLETRTLYERAIALSWIFDVRSDAGIHPVGRLNSNNIAFRRALFQRLPFPDLPTYRGQCTRLGEAIMQAGIVMYEEPQARGAHPAHDGIRGFVSKALHAGRDTYFYDCRNSLCSTRQGIVQWRRDLGNVSSRIEKRRSVIGASALDVLAARALGFVYYVIKLAAYEARIYAGRQA